MGQQLLNLHIYMFSSSGQWLQLKLFIGTNFIDCSSYTHVPVASDLGFTSRLEFLSKYSLNTYSISEIKIN